MASISAAWRIILILMRILLQPIVRRQRLRSDAPWGHPRYPARDGGAERLVLFPKRLLERGFFVRHDGDVEGEPPQRAVDDEAPIAHQHRLTQDDGNERDVDGITHMRVETGHHEIPGRRDGR